MQIFGHETLFFFPILGSASSLSTSGVTTDCLSAYSPFIVLSSAILSTVF